MWRGVPDLEFVGDPDHGRVRSPGLSLTEELAQARDDAEHMARTDHLTALPNRRAFYQSAHYLIEQARRHDRPLAVVLLDVDRFKEVNDHLGHPQGDRALRTVANALRKAGRKLDVSSRIGGDEFVVLLPDASAEAATRFVARFQKELATLTSMEVAKRDLVHAPIMYSKFVR
jgi:diguanylate cyclase (GGDEF)-like protein